MCVVISMVMRTSLMDQLHVLFNPSIGPGPKGATVANAHLNLKVWTTFKIRGIRVPQNAIVPVGRPRPESKRILNMCKFSNHSKFIYT